MVLSASADGACTLANAVRPLKKKKSHGVRSPLCSCSCPASLICALPVDALCAEAIPHRLQPQARRISHARQHQRRSACSLPAFVLPLLIRRPPATRHSRSQGHKAHRQSGSCVFRGRRLVVCLVGRGRHLPSRLASQPSTELSGGVGDGLRIGQGRLGRKGVVWQATFWWGCSSRHGRRRGGRRLRSRNELAMPLNPKANCQDPVQKSCRRESRPISSSEQVLVHSLLRLRASRSHSGPPPFAPPMLSLPPRLLSDKRAMALLRRRVAKFDDDNSASGAGPRGCLIATDVPGAAGMRPDGDGVRTCLSFEEAEGV